MQMKSVEIEIPVKGIVPDSITLKALCGKTLSTINGGIEKVNFRA